MHAHSLCAVEHAPNAFPMQRHGARGAGLDRRKHINKLVNENERNMNTEQRLTKARKNKNNLY